MSLVTDFQVFHQANPQVYDLCVQYALQVKRAGHSRYSMDAVFHRVRWHMNIETCGGGVFKLNDHYTAYYSRLIEFNVPELRGFFSTRRVHVEPMFAYRGQESADFGED